MSSTEKKELDNSSDVSKVTATLCSKCALCIKTPMNFIVTVVSCICFVIVVQQISVCVQKVLRPPVTTHTHFDFNQTLLYPSVTFCREPAYKFNNLRKYGLYGHPRYTSTWLNFPFDTVSLEEVWEDTTYNQSEFFVQYGLKGEPSNVNVTRILGFVTGACFTITPNILSTIASKETGLSVMLQHSAEDIETIITTYPPGYHVYVHYSKEPFSEAAVFSSGLVDYLYINIGEDVDLKLTVNEYNKVNDKGSCTADPSYSTSECVTERLWHEVVAAVGCGGPWMQTAPAVAPCSNYADMLTLIFTYISKYNNHEYDECPRPCRSLLYQAFVTSRQSSTVWDHVSKTWRHRTGAATLQTQMYIYFNSMMVSVYEEKHNYDWSNFLSDLGGNVGFLLGLSVIGMMKIMGKILDNFVYPLFHSAKDETARTLDKKPKEPGHKVGDLYYEKCKEWTMKNDLYI